MGRTTPQTLIFFHISGTPDELLPKSQQQQNASVATESNGNETDKLIDRTSGATNSGFDPNNVMTSLHHETFSVKVGDIV